ncbi:hypothetical protein ACN47E_003560 [Coniothyrium glycines]
MADAVCLVSLARVLGASSRAHPLSRFYRPLPLQLLAHLRLLLLSSPQLPRLRPLQLRHHNTPVRQAGSLARQV